MDTTQAKAAESATAATDVAESTTLQPDTSNLSLAQLDELMTTGKVEVPVLADVEEKPGQESKEPAGDKPEGKPETTEPEKPETTDEPPAKAEEPVVEKEETDDDEPKGKRVRLNATDTAIAAVKKAADVNGTPISWADAEAQVKGVVKDAEPAAPVETPVSKVQSLEAEITELNAKLAEAGLDDANEGVLITKEISDTQRLLARKEAALEIAKEKVSEETAKDSEFHFTEKEKARAKTFELYPDAEKENSPLRQAIDKRIDEIKKNPKHPDYPILWADSAALQIARTVADELGIEPTRKPVTPPVKSATPSAPRTVVSPASGALGTVKPANNQPEDAKQTEKYLKEEASLEELDKAFGADKLGMFGLAAKAA